MGLMQEPENVKPEIRRTGSMSGVFQVCFVRSYNLGDALITPASFLTALSRVASSAMVKLRRMV